MGYIHRAHHCPKPSDGRSGDIWECDECRRQWQMTILGWLPHVPKPAPQPDVTT
ncbi:hypothetical protein [Pseudonocardia sp.]|uniref:hypothetical protein n=1 Tax=Pseudonocardia sp. TaxID=60912 RepID=UPI003D0F2C20